MADLRQDKNEGRDRQQRKPLKADVVAIDQEILRLLLRRYNLLAKMRKNGRLDPAEEKFLRESWQNDVARVSRDAELSGRFFSLMQRISFLPRPSGKEDADSADKRQAFNLAPSALPCHIELEAPLSCSQTCSWLYLAAASGQKMRLQNCLQNDAIIDCIRSLAQMGGAITREDDSIIARPGEMLGAPDKVIHCGSSRYNLYLFIAHYIGRYGRVKFTGSKGLQLADFSFLRRLLPELGSRLVHIVPKSNGLPARLETSGMLPPGIAAHADCPAAFVRAILLAAPFYPAPFTVDLAPHPDKAEILAHILPIFDACGVVYTLGGNTLAISPSELVLPARPSLPVDAELASFLLAFPAVLGGQTVLSGSWPEWPEAENLWDICVQAGFEKQNNNIVCKCAKPVQEFVPQLEDDKPLPKWSGPLLACLAASATLRGGVGKLPEFLVDNPDASDFLRQAGLAQADDGRLVLGEKHDGLAWNAPDAAWALALAVTACARTEKKGWPLGNPGIVTDIWPQFWSLYNSLPAPENKKREETPAQAPRSRRRILTNVVAVPPEIREEDWG